MEHFVLLYFKLLFLFIFSGTFCLLFTISGVFLFYFILSYYFFLLFYVFSEAFCFALF